MEILVVILLLVAIIMISKRVVRRKKVPLTGKDVALKLGLKFNAAPTSTIPAKLERINRFHYGKEKEILNVLSGNYRKYRVTVCDLHYEAYASKDSIYDHFSFYVVELPIDFPEVTIYREGWISKIYQATGHADIDFESDEFSRRFRVRSADPRFAYDFCNAQLIEYLLENIDLSIEIDRDTLCISFDKPLRFEEVEHNLNRLIEIRSRMPAYLFDGQALHSAPSG